MRVGVFGAGAIGTYVGVRLSSVGCEVTLVGRRKLVEMADDLSTRNIRFDVARPGTLEVTEDPAALSGMDLVLVSVKSMHTDSAVEALRPLKPELVVSVQNGLRNVEILKALDAEVVPGMVTFNVIWLEAHLEQATSGPILVGPSERHPDRIETLVEKLKEAKEKAAVREDMEAIQTGKLLLNLVNGVCAVCGLPVNEAVRSREMREVYSICLKEGLQVAKAAKKKVASIGLLSPRLIAHALMLPDAILFRVAKSMIEIDPRARSSTLQDLDRGKPTEIDHLNGEIVRMAESAGVDAPANRFITEQVHRLETQDSLQFLPPAEVLRGVTGAH